MRLTLPNPLLYFSIALLFCSSCAVNYRNINPQKVQFLYLDDARPGEVKVDYRYNVLKESRNGRFAKREKQTGVSLLAVRIENNSSDTLFFPEDFSIKVGEQEVFLYTKNETLDVFNRGDSSDFGASESTSIGELFLGLLFILGDAGNRANINHRFAKELDKYYLWPCSIDPGVVTVGLIALDVKKGTLLQFDHEK